MALNRAQRFIKTPPVAALSEEICVKKTKQNIRAIGIFHHSRFLVWESMKGNKYSLLSTFYLSGITLSALHALNSYKSLNNQEVSIAITTTSQLRKQRSCNLLKVTQVVNGHAGILAPIWHQIHTLNHYIWNHGVLSIVKWPQGWDSCCRASS